VSAIPQSVKRLAISAACLFAAACGGPAETAPVDALAVVLSASDVTTVREDFIASGPRIAGTLEPAQKAIIRAEAGGSVLEVDVELGQRVEKGQRLGRIASSGTGDLWKSAQVGVISADQDAQNAKRELERLQRLAEAGAVSPRDLEMASSAHTAAVARLEGSRAQLSSAGSQLARTTLKAPFDGVVSQRAVNPGDVVAPGSPMFTVIDPTSLRLEGSVPASAAAVLQIGTSVAFTVQGFAERTFTGVVERISPAVDPTTRQIPILVAIPNAEGTLLAGLFADGRVAAERRQGLVVAAAAVDEGGREPAVYRVNSGVVEKVDVAVGLRDQVAEEVEILSGVQAGDILLIGAALDVPAGTKIQLQPSTTTGAGPAAVNGKG
jgi:membrane fusion protein, multidrug efflux system